MAEADEAQAHALDLPKDIPVGIANDGLDDQESKNGEEATVRINIEFRGTTPRCRAGFGVHTKDLTPLFVFLKLSSLRWRNYISEDACEGSMVNIQRCVATNSILAAATK